MRKGTPNEIFRAEFQELVNEKYNDLDKDPHRRVQKGRKSRIRGRNRSAINTKKDKRPIINIQRETRSQHRRNTEDTDNGGQRSDIY
jgi:hypothetical protein